MPSLVAFLPVAVETAAQEGKKVILAMLITGLVFLAVVALGQTSRWLTHRRKARRARQPQY